MSVARLFYSSRTTAVHILKENENTGYIKAEYKKIVMENLLLELILYEFFKTSRLPWRHLEEDRKPNSPVVVCLFKNSRQDRRK